ncbi:MAG TPA: hypothetical protein PKO33_06335 [Pyrinomonadaceae bacterium]|nr:hypothetical protein [Pyrinomonadaceae bacterium]
MEIYWRKTSGLVSINQIRSNLQRKGEFAKNNNKIGGLSLCQLILDHMSQKSKKYRITTETREVVVVRRQQAPSAFGVCPVCQRFGEFLTLESVAERFQMSKLDVIRRLEESAVHAFETLGGELLFCCGVAGWTDGRISRGAQESNGTRFGNGKDKQ